MNRQPQHDVDIGTIDPYDFEAAERVYESIRVMGDDVAAIAQHTGISEARLARIKRHIFYDFHQLDDGVRRFDADPLIVNAWQRLREGRQTLQDVQLLKHEIFEARFEGIFHTTYRIAHESSKRSGRPSGLE